MSDRISGIFMIRNVATGKALIGKASNLRIAKRKYFRDMSRGGSPNINFFLRKDYSDWGEDNFEFEVIEYCEIGELQQKKNYYIDFYSNTNGTELYNLDMLEKIRKPSKEHRKSISKALKGFNCCRRCV